MPEYQPKPMKAKIPESLRRWKPGPRWTENELWQSIVKAKGESD